MILLFEYTEPETVTEGSGGSSQSCSNHDASDGVVGDNDYDGDTDRDDWETEWGNYLDDLLDAYGY